VSRRLKLTLAEILEYPTTHTHKRLEEVSSIPADETSVSDDSTPVVRTTCLPDGRLVTPSQRSHPLWVGTFSAMRQAPAETTGYCIPPLVTEQDFMCVELHGFEGVARSTNVTKALSMNPAAPDLQRRDRAVADGESRQKGRALIEEEITVQPDTVQHPSLSRKSSDAKILERAGSGEAPSVASSILVRRTCSTEKLQGPVWEQPGGTWSKKDENTVRVLRMKKHLEFFGSGVAPEDPAQCVPALDQVLGKAPVFFRRSFVQGTKEYGTREIEHRAASKIQARWRGMRVRSNATARLKSAECK